MQFYQSLRKINTSDCPPEFRVVWTNYLVAWSRHDKEEDANALGGFVEMALGVFDPELFVNGATQLIHKPPLDTKESWEKVKAIAVKFNCGIPANTFDY
jgi:hypothetical protein